MSKSIGSSFDVKFFVDSYIKIKYEVKKSSLEAFTLIFLNCIKYIILPENLAFELFEHIFGRRDVNQPHFSRQYTPFFQSWIWVLWYAVNGYALWRRRNVLGYTRRCVRRALCVWAPECIPSSLCWLCSYNCYPFLLCCAYNV
jgi:hypothetical protein